MGARSAEPGDRHGRAQRTYQPARGPGRSRGGGEGSRLSGAPWSHPSGEGPGLASPQPCREAKDLPGRPRAHAAGAAQLEARVRSRPRQLPQHVAGMASPLRPASSPQARASSSPIRLRRTTRCGAAAPLPRGKATSASVLPGGAACKHCLGLRRWPSRVDAVESGLAAAAFPGEGSGAYGENEPAGRDFTVLTCCVRRRSWGAAPLTSPTRRSPPPRHPAGALSDSSKGFTKGLQAGGGGRSSINRDATEGSHHAYDY